MPKFRIKDILIAGATISFIFLLIQYGGGMDGMKDLSELSMPEEQQDSIMQGEPEEKLQSGSESIDENEEIVNEQGQYEIRNLAAYGSLGEFDEVQEAMKMKLSQATYEVSNQECKQIPKFIWQTAKNPIERDVLQYTRFWGSNHPSYIHKVLDDSQSERLVINDFGDPSISKISSAYTMMPFPVLKADFFRYLVLLARGGVYTDIDTTPIKHINNWIPEEYRNKDVRLIVGIEADPDRPDWHDYYARRVQFCQWTIAAVPGHPVLWELVHKITHGTWLLHEKGELLEDTDAVMDWTGPGIWTDSVFDYLNWRYGPFSWENVTGIETPMLVGDVLILPITSFSPGVYHMGSKSVNDPTAYVRHYFSGSWKKD
ncbi:alpha-1,6-mannosyltransferase Och1 [Schizosaccharomyces octosporus yFS286]|uniref:Alpha-1,6-mannosyltransferase Och1 n=1 Tax=Schizosaccharomyces octosporus (strain yFS286) TaxID=483514 RepID=S9PVW2_SCHOY|nr:alpha-1,6-mannosyltransferase Och1 [Schizosaccharomyces octosporus yFS286]EPX73256.1 alpha-1,6-mannosyltransferase Och1 [Schizosaccharomyces octosporus yFS286]